ncbi:MAG: hydroxymethylglutaryl-CoA lyase [Nitrospirales bacterium]
MAPRDGLQHESAFIPTERKIAFINALAETGVREIEAGAFVSPKAVPQLRDSDEVFRRLTRNPGVVYSALVPNEQGFDRALAAGANKIAVFTAASESFTRHNIHASFEESLTRFEPVVKRAHDAKMPVRGYLSTVTHCPYEGRIQPARVAVVARRLLDLGVEELSLGETLGRAAPPDIRALLEAVLAVVPADRIVLHFHDTYGMAVANAFVAWDEYGITGFDASAGGLGGCPYAPGASGNVATEDLVSAFKASGAVVPVDEGKVVAAVRELAQVIGRPLSSRVGQVWSRGAPSATAGRKPNQEGAP